MPSFFKSVIFAGVLVGAVGLWSYAACQLSPVVDEPGHVAAGLSYWRLQRFDLYNVNPPLARLLPGAVVSVANPKTDWRSFDPSPAARAEFGTGRDFVKANGADALWLVTLARLACLPFGLLGAWVCWRWARELYGAAAGWLALWLWCFSPFVLAHGALATCDMAGAATAALAVYAFWRWLGKPTWGWTAAAGLALGLALLAKFTNLVLLAVLPAVWLIPKPAVRRRKACRQDACATKGWQDASSNECKRDACTTGIGKLAVMVLAALVVINAGYGFEDSFQRLGEFEFVSEVFAGPKEKWANAETGNRFANTWLGMLPVPLPRNYLSGIDVQREDFEEERISYLRGEFRRSGWWYYYLYGLAVKTPCGTLLLAVLAVFLSLWYGFGLGWRNELIVLAPTAAYLALVSSQTGFNHHVRYVLPALPFAFIWVSRLGVFLVGSARQAGPAVQAGPTVRICITAVVIGALGWSIYSSLRVYPHSLSYFNELVDGPLSGPKHLLDSNIDWGQDLTYLKRWMDRNPQARPLKVAYFGLFDPADVYPQMRPMKSGEMGEGWYAVSVNYLYGHGLGGRPAQVDCRWLRRFEPVGYAGYSIYIYHVGDREREGKLTIDN